jgi:hypothetical protein
MQLTTREAARIFRKLGVVEKKSTHHVAGFVVIDGKKTLPVYYSHGNKGMKGPVPHRFRRSLKLSEAEFAELKDCSLSREAYVDLMRQRGWCR